MRANISRAAALVSAVPLAVVMTSPVMAGSAPEANNRRQI